MKTIIFFITHKTLTERHCELTFLSIANQDDNKKFYKFYIYNSQKNELPNSTIIRLFEKYNLNKYFEEKLEIFDYDEKSHKSLGRDIANIKKYCEENYNDEDRVLLLKSDILLSKNYFKEVQNLIKNESIYFTSPFICAKERVNDEEILEYILREKYIRSDDVTFFIEDETGSNDNDFNNRKDVTVYDKNIKFTSCNTIRDFSCHLISVNILKKMNIYEQSWGGVNLQNLIEYFKRTDSCFTVHKYHNIISENRQTDREGPVEKWLLS
jgi:hypothetical protein